MDQKSATLGLPSDREQQIALDANHSNVCKFESIDDDDYEQVKENISMMIREALDNSERSMGLGTALPDVPCSNVPLRT